MNPRKKFYEQQEKNLSIEKKEKENEQIAFLNFEGFSVYKIIKKNEEKKISVRKIFLKK